MTEIERIRQEISDKLTNETAMWEGFAAHLQACNLPISECTRCQLIKAHSDKDSRSIQ